MKIKFIIGVLLTLMWLIFASVLFFSKSSIAEISLSEFGNFLAGFISPVAVIWLVYGYIQQGYELSTQKEEYIKSVKLSAYVAMIEYEARESVLFNDLHKKEPDNNWGTAAKNSRNRGKDYISKVEKLLKEIDDN